MIHVRDPDSKRVPKACCVIDCSCESVGVRIPIPDVSPWLSRVVGGPKFAFRSVSKVYPPTVGFLSGKFYSPLLYCRLLGQTTRYEQLQTTPAQHLHRSDPVISPILPN